jgi:DNA replication protein DnaC
MQKYVAAFKQKPGPGTLVWHRFTTDCEKDALRKARELAERENLLLYGGPLLEKQKTDGN